MSSQKSVISTEAEKPAGMPVQAKLQVSPLRFAPVEMTDFYGDAKVMADAIELSG